MRYSLRASAFLCRNEAAVTHLKLFPVLAHSSSQKPVIQKIPSLQVKKKSFRSTYAKSNRGLSLAFSTFLFFPSLLLPVCIIKFDA